MGKSPRLWIFAGGVVVGFGLIITLFILDAQATKAPGVLPLVNTFDKSPTGFSFKYPQDWEYVIPMLGVMVMGPPETLYNNEPGPTFTVQRAQPLSVMGSLENALNQYLNNGPLRVEGHWKIIEAIRPTQIAAREARVVELEESDSENGTPLHAHIIATSADNTFVYLFTTMVPVDKRAAFDPTLEAMLETVQILE